MSGSTAISVWGGRLGPLTVARIAATTSPIQVFDSSSAGRTPNDSVKTIVFTNPSTNTGTLYVGDSNLDISAGTPLYVFEIAPGAAPVAIDITQGSGITKWYIGGAAAGGPTVMVAQIG